VRHFRGSSSRLFIVGVVGSIMQGAMPALIRKFRAELPEVEVELVELTTVDQVVALKSGRIDAGLGRVRVDDPSIRREVLSEERLMAALPASHPLAQAGEAIMLEALRQDRLILYPSQPRPSYADQVLGMFRDLGALPGDVREVREIQTALGLVAADAGVAVVPWSMRHSPRADIVYLPIADASARSPIILSQRLSDESRAALLFREIGRAEFRAPAEDGTTT
jgi:DNA-binding transcriptional LysR family regulator